MSQRLFEDDVIFLQRLLKSAGLYHDTIDGDWGPNTDEAYEAFTTGTSAIADELGRFDGRSERYLTTLHLPVQRQARTYLAAALAAGFDARVISGTRTYAEQNALYRKGRFGNPGPIVTNARGGRSNHNFGLAWDIGLFDGGAYLQSIEPYEQAATAALAAGALTELEWGGNWDTFKDRPHYQRPTGLQTTELRRRFEAGEPYL